MSENSPSLVLSAELIWRIAVKHRRGRGERTYVKCMYIRSEGVTFKQDFIFSDFCIFFMKIHKVEPPHLLWSNKGSGSVFQLFILQYIMLQSFIKTIYYASKFLADGSAVKTKMMREGKC